MSERSGTTAWDDRSRRTREDQALVRAHVMGDPDAFAQLFRRHRDRLWAVAMRTLGDREEAADALQEAMISAFRNAAGYRGDAAVTTWLHRIVVNACLDRIRRRQARPTVPLGGSDYPHRGDDHGATETRLDVEAALAAIPEAQRAALVLVDMQDVPVAEAAQILGVAEGTIKSRCSRGRVAMARVLRAQVAAQTGRPPGGGGYPPGNPGGRPNVASGVA
ncbi:MAG: RNA polymerase sigma factor SigM, partial [Kineosporiaceae bacterium]